MMTCFSFFFSKCPALLVYFVDVCVVLVFSDKYFEIHPWTQQGDNMGESEGIEREVVTQTFQPCWVHA